MRDESQTKANRIHSIPLSPAISPRNHQKSPISGSNMEENKSIEITVPNDEHSNYEDTVRQDHKNSSAFRLHYEILKQEHIF